MSQGRAECRITMTGQQELRSERWDHSVGSFGGVGGIARYGSASGARSSGSPRFGHMAIARSVCAAIVSDGFTPRFAEIAEPSATWRPE